MNTLKAKDWSLRRTLLAIVMTLTVTIWAFSAVVVYLDADTESRELFDQSLAETAHLLLSLADHELEERMFMAAPPLAESTSQEHNKYLLFQVWDQDGKLVYKSTGAPEQAFVALKNSGFGWAAMNGQTWRSYTSWNSSHRLQIQVVEPSSHRKEISNRFAFKLLLFAVLVLPLLMGGLWWTINRMFGSLQTYAVQVAAREPADLQTLDMHGAPLEIHPLLSAINRLFERVTQSREREQRFTADAAHELRTPLAAVKTNLQVIQRARNDAERQEAVQGLASSIDRANRLVGQLLTLARLEPPYDKRLAKQDIDLAQFCEQQSSHWIAQFDKKHQQLQLDLQPVRVQAHADSLAILLRNLIDNAHLYTPPGGTVRLTCRNENGHARLEVADNGPGIPADMRKQVFDRFVRLSDAQTPGSGLGLSIVKSIADSHQASLVLAEGLDRRGLSVSIVF